MNYRQLYYTDIFSYFELLTRRLNYAFDLINLIYEKINNYYIKFWKSKNFDLLCTIVQRFGSVNISIRGICAVYFSNAENWKIKLQYTLKRIFLHRPRIMIALYVFFQKNKKEQSHKFTELRSKYAIKFIFEGFLIRIIIYYFAITKAKKKRSNNQ